MLKVVREGDKNNAGGRVVKGDPTFLVDNRPVSVDGSPVSPHRPCPEDHKHCHAKTANGTKSFIINNIPVNVVGDTDTCGHIRIEGSETFIIGKM